MIPYGQHYIDEDDIDAVVDVLRNGDLTQGSAVIEFEKALADYVGAKYAVAVSSGTSALHLAAIIADLNADNLLATTPVTFVATSNAALYVNSKPVFVDIDPDTVNISVEGLEEAFRVNKNIKAVAPVHFAGLPCDMEAIKEMSDKAGAIVIEDAAHALGASYYNGKKVGCCEYSSMTTFSFHPVKAIAAGEGGMITTNDESIYRKLLRLRSHGINKLSDTFVYPEHATTDAIVNPWYYEMQELGYNYRITDFQCSLAQSQLKKLPTFLKRRKQLVKKYDLEFCNMDYIRPAQTMGRDISGHHLYVLRIDFNKVAISRAQLIHELIKKGIYTQVHYIPIPYQPYYRNLGYKPVDYPNAQNFYDQALSIPLYYKLTDEEQSFVVSCIKSLLS